MTVVVTVNEGEYGVACVFNTAYNMSAFTTLQLKFTKPDETTLTVAATCPASPLVTVLGTFAANEYAQYYFVDGDLDQTGTWYCRVIYENAGASPAVKLISNQSSFTVTA